MIEKSFMSREKHEFRFSVLELAAMWITFQFLFASPFDLRTTPIKTHFQLTVGVFFSMFLIRFFFAESNHEININSLLEWNEKSYLIYEMLIKLNYFLIFFPTEFATFESFVDCRHGRNSIRSIAVVWSIKSVECVRQFISKYIIDTSRLG